MSEHTKTPWLHEPGKFGMHNIGFGKHIIAETYSRGERIDLPAEANAAFIVRAVNAHYALVAALESARSAVRVAIQIDSANYDYSAELAEIEAALALAKGEA